eukprot:TRINITY_DN4380_c0_g1_i3.p1 TRINITY_DN4380_c0_g1~~TRINITY_DN4380_c0_g1_i3.p1  ORF type:complete len:112 (+),score=34.71 TRINITY_DN4380_c0_g1_i3:76-411(+)
MAAPGIKTLSSSTEIEIPQRREIDPKSLSTTPGGTIYATTPGGTKIVYDRDSLLLLRNSPLSKTPTNELPMIPGVTAPADESIQITTKTKKKEENHQGNHEDHDGAVFSME